MNKVTMSEHKENTETLLSACIYGNAELIRKISKNQYEELIRRGGYSLAVEAGKVCILEVLDKMGEYYQCEESKIYETVFPHDLKKAVKLNKIDVVSYLVNKHASLVSASDSPILECFNHDRLDAFKLIRPFYTSEELSDIVTTHFETILIKDCPQLIEACLPYAKSTVFTSYMRIRHCVKDEKILKLMHQNGLNLHINRESLLKEAIRYKCESSCEYLIKHGLSPNGLNLPDDESEPLRFAIEIDNFSISKLLIHLGAEIKKEWLPLLTDKQQSFCKKHLLLSTQKERKNHYTDCDLTL